MSEMRGLGRASAERDASQPPTRDAEREHARCVAALMAHRFPRVRPDEQRAHYDCFAATETIVAYVCPGCDRLVSVDAIDDHARTCDALWAWANDQGE